MPPGYALGAVKMDVVRDTPATCKGSGGQQTGELAAAEPTIFCCDPYDGHSR
jgi:hypothetical protein